MSNNPVKYERLIKQCLHSTLHIHVQNHSKGGYHLSFVSFLSRSSEAFSMGCITLKAPFTQAIFVAATRCNFCRAQSCNFKIARVNLVRFLLRFVVAISQGFRTCLKLDAIFARQKLHRVAATKIACVNGP